MLLFSFIWIPVVLFFLCTTHKEVPYESSNETYDDTYNETYAESENNTVEYNFRDDTLFCLQKANQSKHYHSE